MKKTYHFKNKIVNNLLMDFISFFKMVIRAPKCTLYMIENTVFHLIKTFLMNKMN